MRPVALQKLNRLPEALRAYETVTGSYEAMEILPDDTLLCGLSLYYSLGNTRKYEEIKQQALERMDDMHASEAMETCQNLFECGMDAGDENLVAAIFRTMDWYMEKHPREIKVGRTMAELKYAYAEKKRDTEAMLEALRLEKEYEDRVIAQIVQERSDARSTYNGSGLGMSIAKSLVEQMGGTISVSSEVGKGSTFVITIPFEIASAPETKKFSPTASVSIQGLNLLLVEDNELNADIAQILLTDRGAKVTLVRDGKQALDRFAQLAPGTFDAILMDVPVMDGLTATRAIRALHRPDAQTIPIIAMTANAYAEDAKACLEAGMNAHIGKPLDIDKVTETVAECCAKK